MTFGQTEGPGRSQPGRRALGAMETAVHRARASQGTAWPSVGSGQPPCPTGPVPRSETPQAGNDDQWAGRDSERWLKLAVVVVAVLVGASGIALAVSTVHISVGPSPTAPSAPPGRSGTSPANRGAARETTTSLAPSTPGAPPQIASLSPASGSPGQTVTVNGSNFLSSDGHIVASFNGQVTATSCPSLNVCTVTVPPPAAGQTSARVTITTASGTSNAIAFSYS